MYKTFKALKTILLENDTRDVSTNVTNANSTKVLTELFTITSRKTLFQK